MPKPRYKTTNWKQYNKALINRGSLTFWIDEETIAEWKQNKQGKRGRPRRFSDLAITTALMVKRIFSMPLRALQGFLDSVFKLANIPLVCPHYTCISRRAKEVEISFKTKTRGAIQHRQLMPLASKFMAKVNGRLRSMVLMGSAEYGVSCISQ
ncbi:User locus_tag [Vibrio sp. B1ASS3]|uniref:transposase n=1 Tax=Vibrio sp. B1ASS3 TaxID=2751176 RepID=UPI001AF0D7EF|nr:transposase [Vibrio sp. B1ASS3]CAD7806288.1 User locus_tag [Vibrio sp. B1ASS3]CAD7809732.1 User locus_tag [Vibrio sp. B1ASS3]CAE6901652.1 User locus_tag [Vibrio sp. B1ASS3]CAE6910287.1 User locus_tag [Vibrio sp. B1ASS3]